MSSTKGGTVADRRYANTSCPYCQAALDPLPTARTACLACRHPIHVRFGPDGHWYLLQEADISVFDRAWEESRRDRVGWRSAWRFVGEAGRESTAPGGRRIVLVFAFLLVIVTVGIMVPVGMAVLSGAPFPGTAVVAPVQPSPTADSLAGGAVPTPTPTPTLAPTPTPTPKPTPRPTATPKLVAGWPSVSRAGITMSGTIKDAGLVNGRLALLVRLTGLSPAEVVAVVSTGRYEHDWFCGSQPGHRFLRATKGTATDSARAAAGSDGTVTLRVKLVARPPAEACPSDAAAPWASAGWSKVRVTDAAHRIRLTPGPIITGP